MTKRTMIFAMILSTATMLPTLVHAQPQAGDSTIDVARAEQLEREARVLMVELTDMNGAAKRLREAAQLRPASDPVAVTNLATAAHLAFYRKDRREARSTMRDAAERALAMGDVVHAAHYLIDIAHLSIALKDGVAAVAAIERAKLLSASPLLSSVEQARLSARIGPTPAAVVASRQDSGNR